MVLQSSAADDFDFDFDEAEMDFTEDFEEVAEEESEDGAAEAANAELDDATGEEDEDFDEEEDVEDDDDVVMEENYVDEDDDEYEYEYEYYDEDYEDEAADEAEYEGDGEDYDEDEDADLYLEDDEDVDEFDEDGNLIPKKRKKKKPKKRRKKSPYAEGRSSVDGSSDYTDWDETQVSASDQESYYDQLSDLGLIEDFDDEDEAEVDGELTASDDDDPNYKKQLELVKANAPIIDQRVKRYADGDLYGISEFLSAPPDADTNVFDEAAMKRLAEHTDMRDGIADGEDEYDEYEDEELQAELAEVPELTLEDVGTIRDDFLAQAPKDTAQLEFDGLGDENVDNDVVIDMDGDFGMDIDGGDVVDIDGDNFLKDLLNNSKEEVEMMNRTWYGLQDALSSEVERNKVASMGEGDIEDWGFSPEDLEEIAECLAVIQSSSYNVTRYLFYDWEFNVTNLILSAFKHNPEAPIVLMHWYPQLQVYKRYKYVRDRNFDFSWEDVDAADLSELERYYQGMGYDKIPTKAPHETGIISMKEMSEDDQRLAAFETWYNEVYNPNMDRVDFDEPDLGDEDNVFSEAFKYYENPENPSIQDMSDDVDEWREEMGEDLTEEEREYRDFVGDAKEYEMYYDPEFEKLFRGHLVVACGQEDSDLEIAEKITSRMDQEFGKQVFVETRVMNNAGPEDSVFEVWLESYEVELLHSKQRATFGFEGWDGPAECDDEQIENLVKEVGKMISDDFRYSYTYSVDTDED